MIAAERGKIEGWIDLTQVYDHKPDKLIYMFYSLEAYCHVRCFSAKIAQQLWIHSNRFTLLTTPFTQRKWSANYFAVTAEQAWRRTRFWRRNGLRSGVDDLNLALG